MCGVKSLPSWECGLKFTWSALTLFPHFVTPFVGVWIEISDDTVNTTQSLVTPFVGVWIEMLLMQAISVPFNCHSLRGSVD